MYEEYIDRRAQTENILRAVGECGLPHALPDDEERQRYSAAWKELNADEQNVLRILYMNSKKKTKMDVLYEAIGKVHMEKTTIYRIRNNALEKLQHGLFGEISAHF